MSVNKTVPIAIVMIFVAVLSARIDLTAQTNTNVQSNAAIVGINIPVGVFSTTHISGIHFAYSWSRHRFGELEALPKKLIGFVVNGSIDYYRGKKETVAGDDYRYGGYLYLHASGGIIYNPVKKGNITLTTGPSVGIYKGIADLGLGIILDASYYVTNTIAVSPGIVFLKHNNTSSLWVVAMRASYCF